MWWFHSLEKVIGARMEDWMEGATINMDSVNSTALQTVRHHAISKTIYEMSNADYEYMIQFLEDEPQEVTDA